MTRFLLCNLVTLLVASLCCSAEVKVDPNRVAQFLFRQDATESVGIGLVLRLLRLWKSKAKFVAAQQNAELLMGQEMAQVIGLTNIDINQCDDSDRLAERRLIQLRFNNSNHLQHLNQRLNELQFGLCVYFMDNNVNLFIDKMSSRTYHEFSQLMDQQSHSAHETENLEREIFLMDLEERSENPSVNKKFRSLAMNLAFLMKEDMGQSFFPDTKELKDHYETSLMRTCSDMERATELNDNSIDLLEELRRDYHFEENLRWKKLYNICLLIRSNLGIFDQAYQLYIREVAKRTDLSRDYMNNYESLYKFFNEPQEDVVSDLSHLVKGYIVRSHYETLNMIMKLIQLFPSVAQQSFSRQRFSKLLQISSIHGGKCKKEDLEYRFSVAKAFVTRPSIAHYLKFYNEQQVDLCRRILVDGVNFALKYITSVDSFIQLDYLRALVHESDPTRALVPLAKWYPYWTSEFLTGTVQWIYLNYHPLPNENDVVKNILEADLGDFCSRLIAIARNRDLTVRYLALVESRDNWTRLEPNLSPLVNDVIGHVQVCLRYHRLKQNFQPIYEKLDGISSNKRPFQMILDDFRIKQD